MRLSIAKLCAPIKQHFAHQLSQSLAMGKKSLNLLLAENLEAEMSAQQISANALGAQSGVAARTIGNYLKKDPPKTSTGKDRSATLHDRPACRKAQNQPAGPTDRPFNRADPAQ